MVKLSTLCIYCGSRLGKDKNNKKIAQQLGQALAERKMKLVYGAGSNGLMGAIADAALHEGAEVIGVIPRYLKQRDVLHKGLTKTYIVNSMHERKHKMFELADAFAVLPGGIGTLDEAVEILTWRQLDLHKKPIVLVDNNGYWLPFIKLINHLIEAGFAGQSLRNSFSIATTIDELFGLI